MAERQDAPRPRITVDHLTTSLTQIEQWCRAVREALDSIPDKEAIRFPETLGNEPLVAQVNPQRPRECPPPEPEDPSDPGKDRLN